MNNKITEYDSSAPKFSISMLVLVLGILGFYFYNLVLANQMDLVFCSDRLEFVSSEKFILNHIGGLMKSGLMKLDAADTNPQAYLANHPNCCGVSWVRNPFIPISAKVSVIYEMSDEGKKNYGASVDTNNYYESITSDTACGETLESIGITTTAPAPIARKSVSSQ